MRNTFCMREIIAKMQSLYGIKIDRTVYGPLHFDRAQLRCLHLRG